MLFDPAVRPAAEEKERQLSFEDLYAEEPHADHGHDTHLHAAYESVSFTATTPMDPRRLMAFLDSRPEGLYRIKGFVDFGTGDPANRYAVHAVGRFLRSYPAPLESGEERVTRLVLIGSGIDRETLLKELEAGRRAADTPDTRDEADARGMWGVLRYVPSGPSDLADRTGPSDLADRTRPSDPSGPSDPVL